MTFSFEPTNEDGSPRVFVGMHRPRWETVKADLRHATVHLSESEGMTYQHRWHGLWLAGEWDRPLYRVEDE